MLKSDKTVQRKVILCSKIFNHFKSIPQFINAGKLNKDKPSSEH